MPTSRATSAIWIRPAQWAWLFVNLVWIHAVVPDLLVRAIAAFRDPQSGVALRFLSAALGIVAIPLVAIVGFAVGTWLVMARVERTVARRNV